MRPQPEHAHDIDPPNGSGRNGEIVRLAVPRPVARGRVTMPRPRDRVALAAIIVALTTLMVGALRMVGAAPTTYRHTPRHAEADAAPSNSPAPPAGPARAAPPDDAPSGELAAPAPQAVLAQLPPAPSTTEAIRTNPLAAPAMVFDASAPRASAAASDAPAPEAVAAPAASDAGPRAVVTQGTLIPAVLETVIAGAAPGLVRAVVAADVRSLDGARVLVPRSSRLVGEYRGGLRTGRSRAYVIWTRLIRPDGTVSDIAAPPPAGGEDDTAFLARFSAAPLLSVVVGTSAGGRVRPGEPVRVLAAHDLVLAPSR